MFTKLMSRTQTKLVFIFVPTIMTTWCEAAHENLEESSYSYEDPYPQCKRQGPEPHEILHLDPKLPQTSDAAIKRVTNMDGAEWEREFSKRLSKVPKEGQYLVSRLLNLTGTPNEKADQTTDKLSMVKECRDTPTQEMHFSYLDDEKSIIVSSKSNDDSSVSDSPIGHVFTSACTQVAVLAVEAIATEEARIVEMGVTEWFKPKIFAVFTGPCVFSIVKFSLKQAPDKSTNLLRDVTFIECDNVNKLLKHKSRLKRFIDCFDESQQREDGEVISSTYMRQELRYLSSKNQKTKVLQRSMRGLRVFQEARCQIIAEVKKFRDDIWLGIRPAERTGPGMVNWTDDSYSEPVEHCIPAIFGCCC